MSSVPESKVPVMPPRILLGPGPSNASPRVLQAMMSPMIGYSDPEFMVVLDEVSELLRLVFQTEEGLAIALPGTGSAGMQAGLNSLLEPGDTVVICSCGYFGERMADMAERVGANAVVLRGEWGRPFPPEMLEEELSRHDSVKMVSVVHAETSTGVLQPLDEIARLAKAHGALLMVDAVTSLGGSEFNFDALGIDYAYSCSQKCLGAPPGICPVAVGPRALEVIDSRTTKPPSWYLDLGLIAKYWGPEHVYHHTAPVSMILGLREALRIVLEEGLDDRIARHRMNSAALRAGRLGAGSRFPGAGVVPARPDNGGADPGRGGRRDGAATPAAGALDRDREGLRAVRRERMADRTDGRVEQGGVPAGAAFESGGHPAGRGV